MYKRYQGNTGRVERIEERSGERRPAPPGPAPRERPAAPPQRPSQTQRPSPPTKPSGRGPGLMEQLGRLLPGVGEELETEDLILLLILYLMYRESGDSELLVIMGAMFLL